MTSILPDPAQVAAREFAASDPASLLEERPGVLRGSVTLTLQTRQAQRLIKGRGYSAEKPAIIGLLGFANLLRTIWHGARSDDPYADLWMLKVHDALELAQQQIRGARQEVVTRFQTMDAMGVATPTSLKPVRVALNFSNPYAFRGAHLVSLYDGLVRETLSARHVGLFTRNEAERALHLGGREVRRVFQSPLGYRFIGVNRRDLDEGTAKALQAREVMGELPIDVRSGARRAPHAPSAFVPAAEVDGEHLKLRPLPASL